MYENKFIAIDEEGRWYMSKREGLKGFFDVYKDKNLYYSSYMFFKPMKENNFLLGNEDISRSNIRINGKKCRLFMAKKQSNEAFKSKNFKNENCTELKNLLKKKGIEINLSLVQREKNTGNLILVVRNGHNKYMQVVCRAYGTYHPYFGFLWCGNPDTVDIFKSIGDSGYALAKGLSYAQQ